MSKLFQRLVYVLAFGVFATLIIGFVAGQFGWFGVHASGEQDGAYRQMHVYAEVLKRIQSDYVTEPNIDKVNTGALHGLLDALDPDSSYLTPTEYKIYKEHPAGMAQIGLTVSKRYGYATIVSVTPGSPADHEHLSDGDVIESIGDQSTREMSLAIVRLLLEGQPGSTVTLSIVRPRNPDPEKITFTRAAISSPEMALQQYDNNTILYLKPGTLTRERVDALADKIKNSGKYHKILLDLRECAKGDEAQGIRLANFFVGHGTIATLSGQKFPTQTFTADASQVLTTAPLAVLVNRGTYGAAELAADAIGGNKRGDVVGERTFGEGSEQKTIELPDGAALVLTVAKYAGPDGKKIQDEAVTPTVEVDQALDFGNDDDSAPATKDDQILNKALEVLKSKNT